MLLIAQISTCMAQDELMDPLSLIKSDRFEEALSEAFEHGEDKTVVAFYDSLWALSKSKFLDLEHYQMAYESSSNLARNPRHGASYGQKMGLIYAEATRWYGTELVDYAWFDTSAPSTNQLFNDPASPPTIPNDSSVAGQYASYVLHYPDEALAMRIEGHVLVQFVVNRNGRIGPVNALTNIGGGCEEEAKKVIQGLPQLLPGLRDGRPAYSNMIVRFIFEIDSREHRTVQWLKHRRLQNVNTDK
ncbi:MAG: energy transducer TonB [Bacteroidota bacterium]